MAKKRVVKDYDALPEETIRLVKIKYPTGYADHLVTYTDKEGKKVSALPLEAEDTYYLIRMTVMEAKRLVKDDVDYDDDGVLREDYNDDVEVEREFDGQGEDDDDIGDGSSDEDDHIIVTRRRDDEGEDIPDDTEY